MKTNYVRLCHSRNNAPVGRGTSTVLRACGQIFGRKRSSDLSENQSHDANKHLNFGRGMGRFPFHLCFVFRAVRLRFVHPLYFLIFTNPLYFFTLSFALPSYFFLFSSLPLDSTPSAPSRHYSVASWKGFLVSVNSGLTNLVQIVVETDLGRLRDWSVVWPRVGYQNMTLINHIC